MARFALAGFIHETNTYSPIPTHFQHSAQLGRPTMSFLRGDEMQAQRGLGLNSSSLGFFDFAEKLGHQVIPIVFAETEPANQVTAEDFDRITGLITDGLSEQGPFDGVFLDLHGAMVYEGFHCGEDEILRRVRAVIGSIPVIAALDLHGNISPTTFTLASALVAFRTYPHVDMYETGERCAGLMDHFLKGDPIYKAFRQIPYLWPISTQSTYREPCRSIYAEIDKIETDPKILSASVMAGFPQADIPHMGPSLFTYAQSQEAADQAADRLYTLIMDREGEFVLDLVDPDRAVLEAIQLSLHSQKPVLLADVQDNAGGGASSDTPWILDSLMRHDAPQAALAILYDPEAAAAAHAAGPGSEVHLGLGGKLTPGQQPVVADYRVIDLFEGPFKLNGPMYRGQTVDLGKMAHVQVGGVHIVVSSVRTQANDMDYFRVVGIEPTEMKILVVKSANHYRADFEPHVSAIIQVEAPGGIVEDPSQAHYRHLRQGVRLHGYRKNDSK